MWWIFKQATFGGKLDSLGILSHLLSSFHFSLLAEQRKKLTMKTLIRIALLLGSLGLTSGATLARQQNIEFAPKDGCKYGVKQVRTGEHLFVISLSFSDLSLFVQPECPVRMECFKDANLPKGGRCDCNQLWFKIPAALPFDDSEWDDGLSTDDCKNHHLARFIAGMFHLSAFLMTTAFIYTDVAVLRELKRAKALKWNATAYSLVFMLIAAVSKFFVDFIYLTNTWDGDKTEFWYHSRSILFVYFIIPFNAIIDFEIGVTWIDLYDRTNKMSKSSSYLIKALRVLSRLTAFIFSFGFLLFVMFGGMMHLLFSALAPSVVRRLSLWGFSQRFQFEHSSLLKQPFFFHKHRLESSLCRLPDP